MCLIQKYNSTDPSNINVFRYDVQSAAVPLRLALVMLKVLGGLLLAWF